MMGHTSQCCDSTSWLWWGCLSCCLYTQVVDSAVEHIYAPVDPYTMNGKTVLTLVTLRKTWNEASSICRTRFSHKGGTLVKVDSEEVANRVRDLIDSAGEDAWIGLYWKSSIKDPARLYWSDRGCTDRDGGIYAQFRKAEDSFLSQKMCYVMEKETGQWRRDSCKSLNNFVCEHLEFSSSCSENGNSLFETVSATFYSVPKNESNSQVCTADCTGILGCFLTWSGNKMCLMGVLDTSGSTFVKSRCFESTTTSSVGMYLSNSDEKPKDCEKIDISSLSDVKAVPIANHEPLGKSCTNNKASQSGASTSAATPSTTTSGQMWTTTVTSLQIVTTTDIRTTTAVSVFTTTTTTTATARLEATTIYASACTDAQTMVVSTTVTELSVSFRPIMSTYISYLNCPTQSSEVSYLCPSVTVTKETENYVTTMLADCPAKSCLSPPLTNEMGIFSVGAYTDATVTATITEFDCTVTTQTLATVKATEPVIYDNPIKATSTVVNSMTTIVETAVTDCVTTTTFDRLVTTTETRTATPSCDLVTPTHDKVTTSTVYVTLTITQALETNTSPKTTTRTRKGRDVNETIAEQEINAIQSLIIEELTLPAANLSSRRRKKESIEDDRLTAKIPGIFACAILCLLFGMVVLIDLPVLVIGLRKSIHKPIEK